MTLKYESELLYDLMKRDGDDTPSDVLTYESELKEKYLNQVVGAYPKLQDYRPEWLNYNLYHHIPSEFPLETITDVTEASFQNVVPYAYGKAMLKGYTKYRDIDTGEVLDDFEDGRNLELVSVKMPVLTTTNEDGTKTNILTVKEDVTLRGVGEVRDTLDCLTGELTQRIGEVVLDGSEKWTNFRDETDTTWRTSFSITGVKPSSECICDKFVYSTGATEERVKIYITSSPNLSITVLKSEFPNLASFKSWLLVNKPVVHCQLATPIIKTVVLSCINEQGNPVNFMPIEGTMSVNTSSQTISPLLDMSVPVEATTQNLNSFANMREE
jgi:hypothetical protein|nr:MAG TPA: hypothetical protein [Caudoviricetes sp.]